MLDRLWHAEQVSEMSSLASPSGNWTAARSCICSCPLAGRTKNREPANVQIKSDLMDIIPPSSFTHSILEEESLHRVTKKSSYRGRGLPLFLLCQAHCTTNPIGGSNRTKL